MRSLRACELLVPEGYEHLVSMDGGFHGGTDRFGRLVEPGWVACGFDVAAEPIPGRTYAELCDGSD